MTNAEIEAMILTPEETEAMKAKVDEALRARSRAESEHDNLRREVRDAIREKVRAFEEKVTKEIETEYAERLTAAREKWMKAIDNHRTLALTFGARRPADPKERVLPVPGTKVAEWVRDYRFYYSGKDRPPLKFTGRMGFVELATEETEYAENLGSWSTPKIGERFVRLLKKDGSKGKTIDRNTGNWFVAGSVPDSTAGD